MRAYLDNKGRVKTLQTAVEAGGLVLDPSNIVSKERVFPVQTPTHQPLRLAGGRVAHSKTKQIAYLYKKGIIFWAETKGKPESTEIKYQKLWPVLRDDFPADLVDGDLDGLVDRIITFKLTADDVLAINTYLVRADNFFVFKDRAWWATRFHLYSGKLADGKNFKGTGAIVQGVPRHQDPLGDYNHINRVFIYADGAYYRMLTEERRMKIAGLGEAYENKRAVINEYGSLDLENWTFVATIKEDSTLNPKDPNKKTPIPGLPLNYKDRVLEHWMETSTGEQLTGFASTLDALYPLPGAIVIKQRTGGYRAWVNLYGMNRTYTSEDGKTWTPESTAKLYKKDRTLTAGFMLISPGKK